MDERLAAIKALLCAARPSASLPPSPLTPAATLDGIRICVSRHIPVGTALPLGGNAYVISETDYRDALATNDGGPKP